MNNILVKKEFLAERCEVCHQSDLFNAEKNYCARCKDVEIYVQKASIKNRYNDLTTNSKIVLTSPFVGSFLAFFIWIYILVSALSTTVGVGPVIGMIFLLFMFLIYGAGIGIFLGVSYVIASFCTKTIYQFLKNRFRKEPLSLN